MISREFLPEVAFCETDTGLVEAAVITKYEELAGVSLYPGDPVRLFLEGVAFLIAQQNALIDFTGKQNLLHYAYGDYLDQLGDYLHTWRLGPRAATATFVVTLASVRSEDITVPRGIRIGAGNTVVFGLDAEIVIPAGSLTGSGTGSSLSTGVAANGYLPGQIKKLIDPVAHVRDIVNSTVSAGGSDPESDEGLRTRIGLAAERYGSAGSLAAYRYHALSAHQGVSDVAIWQPEPGAVRVAILMADGALPDEEAIRTVYDHLNQDEIRPFTDTVTVVPPTPIEAEISLTYYILVSYAGRSASIVAQVEAAVAAYVAWQHRVLGRDLLPQKLIEYIQGVEGVQRVNVQSPLFRALNPWETARVTVAGVVYGGLADE